MLAVCRHATTFRTLFTLLMNLSISKIRCVHLDNGWMLVTAISAFYHHGRGWQIYHSIFVNLDRFVYYYHYWHRITTSFLRELHWYDRLGCGEYPWRLFSFVFKSNCSYTGSLTNKHTIERDRRLTMLLIKKLSDYLMVLYRWFFD